MKALETDPALKVGLLVKYDEEVSHIPTYLSSSHGARFKGTFAEIIDIWNNGSSIKLWWPQLNEETNGVTVYYRKLKED